LSLPCGNSQVVIRFRRFRRRGGVVPERALESNVLGPRDGPGAPSALSLAGADDDAAASFDLRLICARIPANSPAAWSTVRCNAIELASEWSITASARTSNFQNGRFLSSQWFPDRATSAQTNSRAPSVVLNQIDDLWPRSTFHLARDRRSSCRILACHLVAHAKLRLSCGAHPR